MFASTGVTRARASKRPRSNGTPARRASATRWMTAFVEPPSASTVVTALSNERASSSVLGAPLRQASSTMRRPHAAAMRLWFASTAGIEEAPVSVMPSASTAAVIVEAVPIVMQWPCERAMPSSISRQAHSPSTPAWRSAQERQTSDPLPSTFPRQLPRSIGPAGRKIDGMSSEIAPIRSAGVVLSQPPMSTAPSTG